MKVLISLALSMFIAAAVFAQKESVIAELQFLQSNPPSADKLPLPEYPTIAKKAGLNGRVTVDVTLDEKGNVVSADNAAGPYPVCQSVTDLKVMALRVSALDAARLAHFQIADGQMPGGMRGRIIYTFNVGFHTAGKSKEMRLDRMTMLGTTGGDTGVRMVNTPTTVGTQNTDGSTSRMMISGGVLNGTAMDLIRPAYPPAARAVHASGAVNVQVVIMEDGAVYSAKAVFGHPLLTVASETSACASKFTPTLLQGNPVRVSGIITYNFNL